ncbi:MAG: dimethyl sulfoxide reductase anchor subunit family protein [Rhizobiaceae bacterium]
MHPAASIIIFTSVSGLGYGLAAALGLGVLDPSDIATKIAHVLALMLIGAGLLSSTLHLGNPQRAWRAFSQWRSSWLSREGVLAMLAFVPLTVSAALSIFADMYSPVVGLIGAALCVVTVFCTAMIYASLKSIDAWHTPLTPACYLAFAAAGGALLVMFFAFGTPRPNPRWFVAAAGVLIAIAWSVKLAWWRRNARLVARSTPESATGLGSIGQVHLFERPHVTENYLTREMGFHVARKHARKLAVLALLYGGVAPVLILLVLFFAGSGMPAFVGGLAAIALFMLGVVTERWLFFAQARHAVMNYYEPRGLRAG